MKDYIHRLDNFDGPAVAEKVGGLLTVCEASVLDVFVGRSQSVIMLYIVNGRTVLLHSQYVLVLC